MDEYDFGEPQPLPYTLVKTDQPLCGGLWWHDAEGEPLRYHPDHPIPVNLFGPDGSKEGDVYDPREEAGQ
jgi:hypothetical protein